METKPSEKLNQPSEKPFETVFEVNGLNLWYGDHQALKDVNLMIPKNKVTAVIGPSGCGKSTFIKTLNRMVEVIPNVRTSGDIFYHGQNILDPSVRVEALRTRVGMVFQKPNPFPKSILANVMYGPRRQGIHDKRELMEIAEKSLIDAALWDEVKDRLHMNAYGLSGGQQQRLCIARSLAVQPDVLLLDEPTSALDASIQAEVLNLLDRLRAERGLTYVMVSHDLAVVSHMCERLMVMQQGLAVEELTRADLRAGRAHVAYTQTLLAASEGYKPAEAS